MSEPNAVTLHPSVIVAWLRNEADGNGEDGNVDFQNMLDKMADDIEQMYDPAIYGAPAADQ
jgi:predicted nucleotidyltransferase